MTDAHLPLPGSGIERASLSAGRRWMRVATALLFSAAVTTGLFYMMAIIIDDDEVVELADSKTQNFNFSPIPQDDAVKTKKRTLPQEPDQPPETPTHYTTDMPTSATDMADTRPQIRLPSLAKSHSMKGGTMISIPGSSGAGPVGGGFGRPQATSDVIPLVRVPPQYPMSALMKKLEGWVLVVFSISETGQVIDPVVVQAEPPRVFDNAALRAIRRWKYAPRVINGMPEARHGVRVVIDFEMMNPDGTKLQ